MTLLAFNTRLCIKILLIHFSDTSNKNSCMTVKQWSQCSYNMTVRIRQVSAAQLGFSRSSMTFAEATKFSCIYMYNECIPSWIMVISELLMLEHAGYYFLSGSVHMKSDQSLCALYTAVKQHIGGTTRHMDCFSSFSVFFMFTHQSQPPVNLPWYKNLVCELYMQWALRLPQTGAKYLQRQRNLRCEFCRGLERTRRQVAVPTLARRNHADVCESAAIY